MRGHIALLVLLAGLTFFLGLGRAVITDSDEAYYAEAGREMLESGDWLTPYFNYTPRFEKPVLHYWLIATSYKFFGLNEAAARLPSALAGLGLVLLTYLVGFRWYNRNVALLAGVIVATNFGYFSLSRMTLPDLPLTFFIILSTWAGLAATSGSSTNQLGHSGYLTYSRKCYLLASSAAAVGLLTKGPVAILFPLLVIGSIKVWEHPKRIRIMKSFWLSGSDVLTLTLAVSTGILIAAPWFVMMVQEHGVDYLSRFFIAENVARFSTETFNPSRPVWFYLPILAGGLFPWSPFLVLFAPILKNLIDKSRRLTAIEIRLLVWATVPLIFYTLSIGKQPRYILPVLPPLAILLAHIVLDRLNSRPRSSFDRLFNGTTIFIGITWMAIGVLILRAAPLFDSLSISGGKITAGIIVGCGLGLALSVFFRVRHHVPMFIAVGSICSLLALHFSVLTPLRPSAVEKTASAIHQFRQANEPVGVTDVFVRNLPFYSGLQQTSIINDDQAINFLNSSERVMCVLTDKQLARLEARLGRTFPRLFSNTYFNTANIRIRSLIHPDAGGVIQTVLVITNKEISAEKSH